MQRQVLAIKQKVLIQTADIWLASGGADLPKELQREWSQHNTPLKSWIQSSLRLTAAKVPKLAVQADIPEVAPVYQLLPHFEEAQSWEQTWNVEFRTVSWAQKFLNFNERFQRSCSTSLYLEEDTDQWIASFKKGKSLLKGSF
jgi:hypothetical protein